MAKGNGKNGNGQNGNGAKDDAEEGTTSNGANGFRAGRGVSGPKEWSVAEPPAAPAIVVPPRSLTPLVVGAAALALGGGAVYAVHRWRQQQRVALDPGTPEPGRTPGASTPTAEAPAAEAPASETPTSETPTSETPASEAPADPGAWGTTKRGEQYRPLFTKLEEVTGMPLRLYLCVVANREAGWSRTARNKTKGEVKASADGIDNGIKRGNPAPKFAASIRDAGSGVDSRSILGVLLVGDERLPDKLRREELVPLGSRLRTRLVLQPHTPAELAECLTHRLRAAGNPSLMTPSLVHTLCEHALGNPRVLLNTAGELLHAAAQKDLAQLDDKLYLAVCGQAIESSAPKRAAAGRRK